MEYIPIIIAGIGCLLAIIGWADSRRKVAIAEGHYQERISRMQIDIDRLYEKHSLLENNFHTAENATAEMKNDIKWIKDAITRIEHNMEKQP